MKSSVLAQLADLERLSHVWVANYYFSPENKRLRSLAPDGVLLYACPP